MFSAVRAPRRVRGMFVEQSLVPAKSHARRVPWRCKAQPDVVGCPAKQVRRPEEYQLCRSNQPLDARPSYMNVNGLGPAI